MTLPHVLIVAALLAAALAAAAQAPAPMPRARPTPPAATVPGQPRGAEGSGDAGAVVPPPATGDAAVAQPPRNVDPAIDEATGGVDERNRHRSERQPQRRTPRRAE